MLSRYQETVWQQPDLAAFRQKLLDTPIEKLNTGWEDTLVPLGLVMAGSAYQDPQMLDWATRWVDYHLAVPVKHLKEPDFNAQHSGQPNQGIYLTPYCGEWGVSMVLTELQRLVPQPRLLETARAVADHICDGSIRVGNGVIAHGHFSRIAWVDTLYYTAAPLARVFAATGEMRYAQEALQQCLFHAEYLRDPGAGLFFHEAHPETGRRCNWFWSRGNGWVIMALADTLQFCPPDMPGWQQVLEIYRAQVTGLLRWQHSCGLWRIVPENDESHLETSGSIMIASGISVGIRQGWLDETLASSVRRTWNEAITWIARDGRLMGCQTPAGAGGWETHKRSMMGERTYGSGSLLRLAAEMRLAQI